MSSTPADMAVTRRAFLGTATAAALAGPLAAAGAPPATSAAGQAASGSDAPEEAATAAALLAMLRARIGEPMAQADEILLRAELEAMVRADRRLARAALANADEPDTIFRA